MGRRRSVADESGFSFLEAAPIPSYSSLLFFHALALLPSLFFVGLFAFFTFRVHCHLPPPTHPNVPEHESFGRCATLLGPQSGLGWSLFLLAIAAYTATHKLRSLLSNFSSLAGRIVRNIRSTSYTGLAAADEEEDSKAAVIFSSLSRAAVSEASKALVIVVSAAIVATQDNLVEEVKTAAFSSSGLGSVLDIVDSIERVTLNPHDPRLRIVTWLALGWSITDFVRGSVQLYQHLALYAPVYLPLADEDEQGGEFWQREGGDVGNGGIYENDLGEEDRSAPLDVVIEGKGSDSDESIQPSGLRPDSNNSASSSATQWPPMTPRTLPLELPEYQRYGRQMILPSFGLEGQLKLRQANVLVVGAGGLGCPAVQYLAAAGVGRITVVDHDVVERSNLARQVLHNERRIGMNKARSIQHAVADLNPHVQVNPVEQAFDISNASSLVAGHNLILDCTDNPLTRYLINDAAVLAGKTVVSGAGQGFEGQLVLLYKELTDGSRGPCYRCLFPIAPKPSEVTNCEDGGVLGTVTGLVGTLQAVESIKLIAGLGETGSSAATMLLVTPLSTTPFRNVKLRSRRANCRVCGQDNALEQEGLQRIASVNEEDYASFCGLNTASTSSTHSIPAISVGDFAKLSSSPDVLVDVRTREEFGLAKIPGSINIPFDDVRRDPQQALQKIQEQVSSSGAREVHMLCKKGNDSLIAAELLAQAAPKDGSLRFIDVRGGLTAWSQQVDEGFPSYWGGGKAQSSTSALLPLPSNLNGGLHPTQQIRRVYSDEETSSTSSTTSSASELSMIHRLEEQIDRLVAARRRVKLEQSLGASLPELPSALAALWRLGE